MIDILDKTNLKMKKKIWSRNFVLLEQNFLPTNNEILRLLYFRFIIQFIISADAKLLFKLIATSSYYLFLLSLEISIINNVRNLS